VQVAAAIAIGFVKLTPDARRNLFHDLRVPDENVRRGMVEVLRWTQGSDAT
jgi:hypothetical protein